MTYKLFIDDERFPVTDDWVIVRSSEEASKYVVDFCISDGTMKIIEYNCIHCSGFYTCNIAKILQAIVNFIERKHHES